MGNINKYLKPNFFIPGAAKSGTTTLHKLLNLHPDISMSKIKEPVFWNNAKFNDYKEEDWLKYKELFNPNNKEALDYLKKRGLEKLVTIKSWASCGVEQALMGTGPIPSTKKALELVGWDIKDVDLFEINEAFAAQSLAVINTLSIPEERVNVNGGAIALGHPIGASGTRILVTLIHEMIKRDVKKGLATLCIGGGMGITMCLER